MNHLTKEESEDPLSNNSHTIAQCAPVCAHPCASPNDYFSLEGKRGVYYHHGTAISLTNCTSRYLHQIIDLESGLFPPHEAYDGLFLEEEIASGKYFIALDEGNNIIGYFGLDRVDSDIYISNIAVIKDYHGNGICRWFLDVIIARARELGMIRLTLHVSEHNHKASCLYRSCGFVIEDHESSFYDNGNGAYFMALPL